MVKLFTSMISKKEVKKLSDLSVKKGRDAEGKFLIEGYRIIRSALRNNAKIDTIYGTNKFKSSKDFANLDGLISEKINSVPVEKNIHKNAIIMAKCSNRTEVNNFVTKLKFFKKG